MILNAIVAGEGRPVALLHGLFGQARNFGEIQRHLAARFRVLALDLRNHGASPHGRGMSYSTMAADVIETLRARDALPACVVGHSMGGKVAMATALMMPDVTNRLVVADIAPVPYRSEFENYVMAMQALRLHPGLSRVAADAALSRAVESPRIRAFLLQNLRLGEAPGWKIGLPEIAASMKEIMDWDVRAPAPFSGPTLFVSGSGSDYIRTSHRPAIRALFPRSRFVTLKNAGHWLHADAPAAFIGVLESFFGEGGNPAP
jgi:pimeloyl-ACP methyl ester carboxylesterase